MARDLVFEIGTEEIPASYLNPAAEQLKSLAAKFFAEQRIPLSSLRTYHTPCRLVLWASGVGEEQDSLVREVLGPPKNRAFDDFGKPTQAALGFAQAQGVEVAELGTRETPRGTYICAVRREEGRATTDLLREFLPQVIRRLGFPRMMRWGAGDIRFARPIRWILALFGGEVIAFSLDGISSGRETRGQKLHEFQPISMPDAGAYLSTLKENQVQVDFSERRQTIQEGIARAAAQQGGEPLGDPELLDEVTNLVEYPVPLAGRFEEAFLALPRDVVVVAMREHQRYFSVVDDSGKLLPVFVLVANGRVGNPALVVENNRKVLAARLADAGFFWEEDKKIPLVDRVEELRGVVWQKDLGASGSLYAKTQRLREAARAIAALVPGCLPEVVDQAALLSKADLVTNMVREKEFTKLQGVMGREYALAQGADKRVAEAIFEHYLPRFPGDLLPKTPEGKALSVADKLDTLIGFFHLNQIPSGSEDPFGLRRQAAGVVQIILDSDLSLSLRSLVDIVASAYKGSSGLAIEPSLLPKVLNFLGSRVEVILEEEGIPYDLAEATLAVGFDDLVLTRNRARALKEAGRSLDFERIVIGQKRCANILKGLPLPPPPQESGFEDEVERRLYREYLRVKSDVARFLTGRDYPAAFAALLTLREPIDAFFDGVLVMCDDEALRTSRLSLLKAVSDLFLSVADFSKIVIAGNV